MSTTRGIYYDGKSSAQRAVVLTLNGDRLGVSGEGVERIEPFGNVVVSSQLSTVLRTIRFADGAVCEVRDNRFVDELLRRQGKGRLTALLHRWEGNLPAVAGALLMLALVIWGFLTYGVPALARKVAFSLPAETEAALGVHSMEILDRLAFKPSKLQPQRQRELTALFSRMTADFPDARNARIEFRSGEALGANALALPSGIIVVTDELVKLARNDEEIAAVLSHEFGHLRHRHTLRHILQNSAAGLVLAAITGDIMSVTSLSAGLPTALVNAKFSRDFEIEADDTALEYLKKRGIPLKRFADMLTSLQSAHDKRAGEKGSKDSHSVADYFSSHPVTEERIKRFMGSR